ncbi:hypothetical protein, partial [Geobacillus thermoleovorans]|uniref:hypothetical protein n=2 Tax=Geobacillus thermoleovorans group TaxID=1505648 RepID=UPI00053B4C83
TRFAALREGIIRRRWDSCLKASRTGTLLQGEAAVQGGFTRLASSTIFWFGSYFKKTTKKVIHFFAQGKV